MVGVYIGQSLSLVYDKRDDATKPDSSKDLKSESSNDMKSDSSKDSKSDSSNDLKSKSSSSLATKLSLSSITSSKLSSSSKNSMARLPTLSSSFTKPTVTVPPNSDNPFIYRTHNPSGTVFIAFGAIIGFALVVVALIWILSSVANRKNASKGYFDANLPPEKEYANFVNGNNDGDLIFNPFYNTRSNGSTSHFGGSNANYALKIFSHSRSTSNLALEPLHTDMSNRNSHDLDTAVATKKNMFISPTAELLQKHKSMNDTSFYKVDSLDPSGSNLMINRVLSQDDLSNHNSTLDEIAMPARANLSTTSVNATTSGRRGRTIPSMYLENMFDQSEFNNSPRNSKIM